MPARRGQGVGTRSSVLAACLAALLLSLSGHVRAEPEVPELIRECREALGGTGTPGGAPGPCDQAEGLAALVCPVPPPVLDRSVCKRTDDIFAATLTATRENVNDTFTRYVKFLPSRLPEPEPGPIPFVVEQMLDYVDSEFNGDDIDAVVILVIGEGSVQNQTDRSLFVVTNLTSAFADVLVDTTGVDTQTDGLVCTLYRVWSETARDLLLDAWNDVGIEDPPFPYELFPTVCTPGGVDISLSWMPNMEGGTES